MAGEGIKAEIERLEKLPCECIRCYLCKGNGTYRVDMRSGLPQQGIDDLYDLEYCDQCHNGITEMCERCRQIGEFEIDLEFELENEHGE